MIPFIVSLLSAQYSFSQRKIDYSTNNFNLCCGKYSKSFFKHQLSDMAVSTLYSLSTYLKT